MRTPGRRRSAPSSKAVSVALPLGQEGLLLCPCVTSSSPGKGGELPLPAVSFALSLGQEELLLLLRAILQRDARSRGRKWQSCDVTAPGRLSRMSRFCALWHNRQEATAGLCTRQALRAGLQQQAEVPGCVCVCVRARRGSASPAGGPRGNRQHPKQLLGSVDDTVQAGPRVGLGGRQLPSSVGLLGPGSELPMHLGGLRQGGQAH